MQLSHKTNATEQDATEIMSLFGALVGVEIDANQLTIAYALARVENQTSDKYFKIRENQDKSLNKRNSKATKKMVDKLTHIRV